MWAITNVMGKFDGGYEGERDSHPGLRMSLTTPVYPRNIFLERILSEALQAFWWGVGFGSAFTGLTIYAVHSAFSKSA